MKQSGIFLFFLLICTSVFSQINQYGIPFITNYSAQEYGASVQNWAVVQDNRGVVYFGNNDNGVLEYDGVNWRKIPIDNNSIVRSLAVGKDGIVYVGGQTEFGFLAPNINGELYYKSLIYTIDTSDLDFLDVWKTFSSKDGVCFCTTSKIFLYNNDTTKIVNLKNGAFFSFLVNNQLYNGHYLNGLEVFNENDFQLVKKGEYFSKKGIFTINNYVENSLLIGAFPHGLYTYNLNNGEIHESLSNTPANKYLKENQLYNSLKLDQNHFAFATINNGMIIMDNSGSIIDRINKKEGLQNETVINLYSKKNNYKSPLWLALDNGISKVEINSPFRKFSEVQGLNGLVYDIEKINNTLFVATTLGVYRLIFDENNFPFFDKVDGIDVQTWSLAKFKKPETNNDILLAGTINGLFSIDETGESKYIDHQIRKEDEPDGKIYITKLYKSTIHQSEVYVGCLNVFFTIEYKNGRWQRSIVYEDIKDEIRHIEEDIHGNIWLGTYLNGVIQIENYKSENKINKYDASSGLPGIKAIYLSKFNNEIVFGTNKGIYKFDYNTRRFSPNKELGFEGSSDEYHISAFTQKSDSVFFISAFNTSDSWTEIGTITSKKVNFERSPFLRLPNEQIDVIYPDDNEITWLGGSTVGIYSYNANFNKDYKEKFHTLIRRIYTLEDSVLFHGTYYKQGDNNQLMVDLIQPNKLKPELPFNQNSLAFEYAAPFFEEEKKNVFSYKLDGYKDVWSKWSSEPKAVFTNLNEGKYVFYVKAKNIYDVESEIASFQFSITPPWYRTIIAYIFYGILAIFIVYIIVKLYTRKLELEKIRLEGIVEERTAEIRNKNVELETKNVEITKQHDQISKQKEHITDSIKYAQRIQQAVVPSEERENELLKEHFLLWRPRDIVSGDFWWMTEKNNKIILAAADCTGHGVPGAFMSMLGVSFLNEIVNKLEDVQAHLILNQLRASVKSTLKQTGKDGEAKDGMDIALVIIDYDNMTLQYSGAYNPLYLYRKGELIETKADKNPIGIYVREKDSFTAHDINLEKGDTIYIFSDGYVDQFGGEKKDKFKSKKFKQLLLDNQHLPMDEQKDLLNVTIDNWMGDIEQIDDIIIIGVRF
jgi:serine phosphatase RsbU (regulator of sigma subunit)/ligand-binding sensor domain-containing protein